MTLTARPEVRVQVFWKYIFFRGSKVLGHTFCNFKYIYKSFLIHLNILLVSYWDARPGLYFYLQVLLVWGSLCIWFDFTGLRSETKALKNIWFLCLEKRKILIVCRYMTSPNTVHLKEWCRQLPDFFESALLHRDTLQSPWSFDLTLTFLSSKMWQKGSSPLSVGGLWVTPVDVIWQENST